MTKFSKAGVPLFAAAMALCAFMMPSMASASSWGVVGSHHTLDSPNLGYTSNTPVIGPVTSICTRSSFTTDVSSTRDLEITNATFGGLCTWTSSSIGTCTATPAGTRFPWTATAVTTDNIQIHGIRIDVLFENVPGLPAGSCAGFFVGETATITGTLTGGRWTGNGAGQHSLDFSNAAGLVEHLADLGSSNNPIAVRGILTDTQQSLTVTG
jgi:hypothetical protein